MENLFEQFKSGKRTEIYVKDNLFNRNFLVYLKLKEQKEDKLMFISQEISLIDRHFSFSEGETYVREISINRFKEIPAELFYEAYDIYVKYQSCEKALEEIFNKL